MGHSGPEAPPADRVSAAWRSLRAQPLQAGVWLALAQDYAGRGLALQAGYAARQALLLAPASAPALDALALGAWRHDPHLDAALGRPAPAAAAALAAGSRQALAASPGDWISALFLARLDECAGGADAAGATHLARALEPIEGETLHWLGRWRLAGGDAAGAVAALSQLLDVRPVRCGSMMVLGEALLRLDRTAAAEKAFARASLSNSPGFLLELAHLVCGRNYWREAIAILHKALALQPDSLPHLLRLANIQHDLFALDDCRATIARIRRIDPGNRAVAPLEWGMHGRMGDARAHLAALQGAQAADGAGAAGLASSIAMVSLYDDTLDAAQVAHLHRQACAALGPAATTRAAFANGRDGARRLRIGYVTGDLHRQHPVNLFLLPLLRRHDHARFEIAIYFTGAVHDAYTAMARACSERWTDAHGMDDAALRRAIVDDGVDILVDLAGHCASHRLGVFALRAAPVQASFLGYPHSTGLANMDWLIGDAVVSPAAHAGQFSEAIAQLPGSVFCWAPVDDYPLPPPRAPDAPIVFACFNNVLKLSPSTIAMWARILHALPGSLLLLKSASLDDAGVRRRFTGLFGAHGIDADRLLLRGPSGLEAMMDEYGQADIALDPAPYNGGTTTLQALWMGVPVVALEGHHFAGRMGASFLRALGRPDWVAQDADGYVAAALALARALPAVRGGRAALRARMRASPVSDIASYARHFEAALRGMWQSWCDGDDRRLLPAGEVAAAAARAERAAGQPATTP